MRQLAHELPRPGCPGVSRELVRPLRQQATLGLTDGKSRTGRPQVSQQQISRLARVDRFRMRGHGWNFARALGAPAGSAGSRVRVASRDVVAPTAVVDGRLRDTKLEWAFGETHVYDESVPRLVDLGLLCESRTPD